MTTAGSSALLVEWLQRPRTIYWSVVMGLNARRSPVVSGQFSTTLGYLDDQGEKWGETYVKVVGQHFDDYAHWDAVQSILPVGGPGLPVQFVPRPFSWRELKGAAHGVTGLIGEVLVTVFLQRELGLGRADMAHLFSKKIKAPDLCLDVEPPVIGALLKRPQGDARVDQRNQALAADIEAATWTQPLPIECKSRRSGGGRAVSDALQQLVTYWREIPDMAGYGIFAQVDVLPVTTIKLHLLAPKPAEAVNVRKIVRDDVQGTPLVALSDQTNYREFQERVGGRLLG